MSTADWKFVLARSRDLVNLGELTQARDRQFQAQLNRSGSLSFNIPMSDALGAEIQPHTHAVKAYRKGSAGQQLIWSGYVNTVEEDAINDRMSVSCVGWYERLGKRLLMKDTAFEKMDDADIAKALLAHANAGLADGEYPAGITSAPMPVPPDGDYTVHWPAGSQPNTPTWLTWGGTLDDDGGTGRPLDDEISYKPLTYYVTTNPDGTTHTAVRSIATLPHFQTVIQTEIQNLSDTENGYDWRIDPATRKFFIYRIRGIERSDVVLGYRFGPENVAVFNRSIDGSTLANFGIATGSGVIAQGYLDEYGSQDIYGPFEEVYSLPDRTDLNVLRAYAVGEIALKWVPRQIYAITPFNWTSENSVPEPFVDYDIGDRVSFVARQLPRISINQLVRVFGISISIDAEGNEKISQLQTSA